MRSGLETCIISGKITKPNVSPFMRVAWKVHLDPCRKLYGVLSISKVVYVCNCVV